ncbi:MAG: hypothetical protein KGV59_05480 [Tenacibaculum sp.]|nr:hypothetical protein [Tenacibaculum sp.]
MKTPKFNISDEVYHITPESPKGIVVDCHYSMLDGRWTYEVSFGVDVTTLIYEEHELSDVKTF